MVQTVEDIMGKNLPEKKFKAGAISATIWKNEVNKDGKSMTFRTVSLDRNYKDKDGNWKTTHSMRSMDLPKATLVLNKAYEFIVTMDGDE
jgi:hypothetical protein